MITRLLILALTLAATTAAGAGESSPRPPRVLFSNDATNIVNVPPPGVQPATVPERLEASVAEAAGADVHVLQPGNGWVPWWRSAQYPAEAHYRWFTEVAAREPDRIGRYMRDGGDLVAAFIASCRARGVAAYVSLRLNDYHGSESWDALKAFSRGEHRDETVPLALGAMAAQSRVLLERPELQLQPDPADYVALPWAERLAYAGDPPTRFKLRTARIWNWAEPEVPAYKLAFVRELCAGYDLDGLELDFMRWASYFHLEETTGAQRRAIMLDFIRQARAALDENAPAGRRRTLGVRVPGRVSGHDPLGIDLRAWVEAGVDWVNLSCHYLSTQQTDLAAIHRLIPDTPLYLELTFANAGTAGRRRATLDRAAEARGYGLMTAGHFFTAAHLAYARGAAGVSLFNFVYYRNLGAEPHVPPFEVLERLKDPAWLARQPQHYFLSDSSIPASAPSDFSQQRRLQPARPAEFVLDLAPPEGGWRKEGRLRLEATRAWDEGELRVSFNGTELNATPDVSEPYASSYAPKPRPERLRAWLVPRELLRPGENRIEVTLLSGAGADLRFLDLAMP
ncbi:MAG TPA: hypothetical protein VHN79_08270, partial [Lacunisphaera sp.]|nr:hypothetical protein [Lacunisphaera sp.]